jgi:hypothetical protein
MAALTPGWIATGITKTMTLQMEVELRAFLPEGGVYLDGLDSTAAAVLLTTRAAGGAATLCGTLGTNIFVAPTIELVLFWIDAAGMPQETVLDSVAGACVADPAWLGPVTVLKTIAGLRLGVTVAGDALIYRWFVDDGTTATYTIGGNVVYTHSFAAAPVIIGAGPLLSFGLLENFGDSDPAWARFDAFEANSIALSGRGPVTYNAVSGTGTQAALKAFGPHWQWTANLVTRDENGASISSEVDYEGGTYTTPAAPTFSDDMWVDSAPADPTRGAGAAVLNTNWANALTIRPDPDEWPLRIEGMPPKAPGAVFTAWEVGTLSLAATKDCLLSTAVWTPAGSISVTAPGDVPPTEFVVAGAGSVTRPMTASWRDWNDPDHGDYQPDDDYTATDHTAYAPAGQDVWGWGAYAYLEVGFDIPAATTLTFTVAWASVDVNGAVREITRTYTKAWAASGTQTLDLMFPDEGDRPFYGDRVDSLTISGFEVGTYQLNHLRLRATADAYVKLGGETEDSRDNARPGGVVWNQDGQFSLGQWNGESRLGDDTDGDALDDYRKDHQNGHFEYADTETDPVTATSYGGAAGMGVGEPAALLPDLFTELNLLEGLTAVYSTTAMDAAFSDADGNELDVARAIEWLLPNLPFERVSPGSALTVYARLVVADVSLPAGLSAAEMVVHYRQRLGSVLVGQAVVTGTAARAGAGITVRARAYVGNLALGPTGLDGVVTTATTDSSGFAALPVRTGRYLRDDSRHPFGYYLEGL